MQLEIVTPEKLLFKGDVDQLTLTTADGKISVLPNHVNLFTKIIPGELLLKIANRTELLAITGGFMEVSDNKVTILADYAVHVVDINVDKAIAAQKRAEELLKKKEENLNEQEFAEARAELGRAILELHVANRHRRKSN